MNLYFHAFFSASSDLFPSGKGALAKHLPSDSRPILASPHALLGLECLDVRTSVVVVTKDEDWGSSYVPFRSDLEPGEEKLISRLCSLVVEKRDLSEFRISD